MELDRKKLKKCLKIIKPGIINNGSEEFMSYVYFSGEYISSYNNVISIQYPFQTDFSTFVKADEFIKVIDKLKSDIIEVYLENGILVIKENNITIKFNTIFDDTVKTRMKSLENLYKKCEFNKLHKDFVQGIQLCSRITGKANDENTLGCVCVNEYGIWGTDNYSLSYYKIENTQDMLIPGKEVKSLLEINPVEYALTDSWIHFLGKEDCIYSIRKVLGEYPDMRKYINGNGSIINFPDNLRDSIKLASVFITSKDDELLTIVLSKNKFTLSRKSETGKFIFKEKIKYNGDDISFTVSRNTLEELLHHTSEVYMSDITVHCMVGNYIYIAAIRKE